MLKLTGKQPLVYEHPLSYLVTSLPYIDESDVPKTVVNYMVRTEAIEINQPISDYLKDFPLPKTPFIDSPEFDELVKQAQQRQNKPVKHFEVPNVEGVNGVVLRSTIDYGFRNSEYNLLRNANIDISTKLGPVVLKEHLSCMDKLKETLQLRIAEQQRQIEELNAKRKYEQLECRERLDTIGDRVKMLLATARQH